jgi:CRISPR/Cas system-associated exonuclease Cas4 (RecB family)
MKTIRASEINSYLYCTRAWWYRKQGFASKNHVELAVGQEIHARHGKQVFTIGCLRTLAYALLLLALALLAAYLTMQLL